LLKVQQKRVDIAMQAIEVASHTSAPSLEAELEFSEYAKDGPNRDDWRASIYFDVPLYDGSRESSAVRIARARYNQALADLQKTRSALRVEVLRLWQEIRQNSLRLEGELVNQGFRDLALDRARTEYQLEFKADLGDSMVEYSNSRMLAYQARYALEMSWIKLEKLLGKEFLNELTKPGGGNG
jgi:outer membrane protein TolC